MGIAVVTGAMLKCPFGIAPSVLNVLPINRILVGGKPAATIMDNKPMINISPFVMCTSPANPAVIAALGAPSACIPVIPAPWIVGSPTVIFGTSGPALNNTSKLMCIYGGVIQILTPGQINVIIP